MEEADGDDLPDEGMTDSEEFLRAVARAPAAAPRTELPSSDLLQLAHFRIVEKIGRGGMGIVYRAEDEKLRRVVALKVLPEDFDDDPRRRKRFLREARVAAALAHPNIATIHEVGEADGRIFIAMELVAGTTLRAHLEKGRLTIDEALRIAKEIARGVGKAHERGIAHRDLKPDNVMVTSGGDVKVLDFGLAKPTADEAGSGDDHESITATQEGRIVGTPGYMSPEQATGRATDVRTDVFALGVILYEMLSGSRPFKGETSMDTLIATSRDEYTPLSKIVPGVSQHLERVIARALAKDPAERPADAGALLAELEALARRDAARPRRTGFVLGGVLLVTATLFAIRAATRPGNTGEGSGARAAAAGTETAGARPLASSATASTEAPSALQAMSAPRAASATGAVASLSPSASASLSPSASAASSAGRLRGAPVTRVSAPPPRGSVAGTTAPTLSSDPPRTTATTTSTNSGGVIEKSPY